MLLTVHLISGNMNEALDVRNFSRFQQNMGSHDIILRELEGISKRVVDMSLGSEMHDGINLFSFQNKINQIRAANISLNKFVIW